MKYWFDQEVRAICVARSSVLLVVLEAVVRDQIERAVDDQAEAVALVAEDIGAVYRGEALGVHRMAEQPEVQAASW